VAGQQRGSNLSFVNGKKGGNRTQKISPLGRYCLGKYHAGRVDVQEASQRAGVESRQKVVVKQSRILFQLNATPWRSCITLNKGGSVRLGGGAAGRNNLTPGRRPRTQRASTLARYRWMITEKGGKYGKPKKQRDQNKEVDPDQVRREG